MAAEIPAQRVVCRRGLMDRPSHYDAPVFAVSLVLFPGPAEEAAERIRAHWAREPVLVGAPGGDLVELSTYFDTEVEALLAQAAMAPWSPRGTARLTRIEPRDWATAHRQWFHPRPIGERLEIRPVWEPDAAGAGERVTVWIDPGLSFGTGEHFTTLFCLEMMDRLWRDSPPASFLDVGTGSGVLAIAAARLGCLRVVAMENDRETIPYARNNACINGVDGAIVFLHHDIRHSPVGERFECVCANLYGGLLIACAPTLARITRGRLLLSGIRAEEVSAVAEAYTGLGGREEVRDGEGEWAGLVFAFEDVETEG